ncbi:MAG: phenylalanine--tRNA ligase subunit alpha, partial [Oscillospiraceae bacterium]|nr:phenylalanine--tRNA ligase subunit alpha [Oscillospiraceae bacterium]
MKEQLEAILQTATQAIRDSGAATDLEALRVKYLGKKGELTAVLKQMGKLAADQRPAMGKMANEVRAKLETALTEQAAVLAEKAMEARLALETVDVTIPGKAVETGRQHPMYIALDEFKEVFINMGFEVIDGPEV